jgi:hypothetical protein
MKYTRAEVFRVVEAVKRNHLWVQVPSKSAALPLGVSFVSLGQGEAQLIVV